MVFSDIARRCAFLYFGLATTGHEIDEHATTGHVREYNFDELPDSNLESEELPSPSETAPRSEPQGLNLIEIQQAPARPLNQTMPIDSVSDAVSLAAESILQKLEESVEMIMTTKARLQGACSNVFFAVTMFPCMPRKSK